VRFEREIPRRWLLVEIEAPLRSWLNGDEWSANASTKAEALKGPADRLLEVVLQIPAGSGIDSSGAKARFIPGDLTSRLHATTKPIYE